MRRRVFLLGISAALVAALAGGCAPAETARGTLTYGLTLSPTGIDPHLNASAELGIPLSSVYDTLVFQDPETGEFLPGLASSWSVSDDGLDYTFNLRPGVRFHDGSAFDAGAVVANIDYVMSPDNHSQKAVFMLGPLESVEAVDDRTVVIHLNEPFPPLLDSLSQVYLGMASPEALETWGPAEYQFHQVGTGPFRFVEYVPNDHLTLERNPEYAWGPEIYRNKTARVERVIFRFYVDVAARSLALENGDADVLGEIPIHESRRLETSGEFVVYPVPIPGQPMQFLFNTLKAPTDDLSVRLALLTALDRAGIVDTVFGSTSPVANGPLSASNWGSSAERLPDHDPRRADRLLTEAGWTVSGGVRAKDGEPLRLTIVAPIWGNNPEVAQLMQAAWEILGAQVELRVVPSFGELKESQESGEYHVIGINFFGTDPDLLRPMFASDGIYNWTGYQDPLLDDLLVRGGSSSTSQAEREAIYGQVSQIVINQVLIVPVRDYVNLVVANRRVQGLRFAYAGWFPLLIDLQLAS
ncbi:MAG TPA: ABC transporter substrate-binding protein [Anaerolineales bacterium]|nr:ABC transporter substrate-binding protein [Anaerolineales bacterium]